MKLIEATLHARKYLGGQQDTDYGLRAGGLLAYGPETDTEPYSVRGGNGCGCMSNVLILPEHVLLLSVGLSRRSIRQDTQRDILASTKAASSHRALGGSLCTQDTSMSLSVSVFVVKRQLFDNVRLPNLLDRAQRTRQERSVRSSFQELCRERPRRPSEWSYLWSREALGHEREDWDCRRKDSRSD